MTHVYVSCMSSCMMSVCMYVPPNVPEVGRQLGRWQHKTGSAGKVKLELHAPVLVLLEVAIRFVRLLVHFAAFDHARQVF